jgi:hypothetical protein
VSAAGKDGVEHDLGMMCHTYSAYPAPERRSAGFVLVGRRRIRGAEAGRHTSSAILHDGGDHGYVCLLAYSDMMVADAESRPEQNRKKQSVEMPPFAVCPNESPGCDRAHHHMRISVKP